MLIAQISDTHVTTPGQPLEQRFATAAHLQRAVHHLVSLPKPPDVVLITGDCVDGGSVSEYERFREFLQPLDMPVYVIPGNHDNREHMRQVFGAQGALHQEDFIQYVVNAAPLRLIALDTLIPGQGGGRLCRERLHWLEERLTEDRSSLTILFQHHPPFAIGVPVFDRMGFEGTEEFGSIIARHSNVERILAGHVHCHVQRRFQGTIAVTCPSTAHQTHIDLRQQESLAAVMTPAACLLHLWTEETGLVTYTSPIGEYGPVDQIYDGKKWLT